MMKRLYLVIAAMMLLCLAPMPYGYFQLVRLLATIAFGFMSFRFYQERKEAFFYTFGALTLLFQPLYKIALGRTIWNIIDVIVAIGLILLFIWDWKNGKKERKGNVPIPPNNPIKVEPIDQ